MTVFKKILAFGLFLGLCLLGQESAQALPGPNPAPRVLLIYTNDSWLGTLARDNVMNILTTTMVPAPIVDSCEVTDPAGDVPSALAACGTSLANYCQVWDIRFVFATSGITQDNVSAADEALYTNFLS